MRDRSVTTGLFQDRFVSFDTWACAFSTWALFFFWEFAFNQSFRFKRCLLRLHARARALLAVVWDILRHDHRYLKHFKARWLVRQWCVLKVFHWRLLTETTCRIGSYQSEWVWGNLVITLFLLSWTIYTTHFLLPKVPPLAKKNFIYTRLFSTRYSWSITCIIWDPHESLWEVRNFLFVICISTVC